MLIAYAIALTLLNAVWLFLNVLGLPGNWLMIASAAAVAWLTRDEPMFHWGTLVALVVLAVVGELLEFLLGAAGAAKSGGSRWGAVGAILGAIVGGLLGTVFIPIPVIGSILGACAGAFLGAMAMELRGGKKLGHAATIGHSAAKGRLWGTIAKLAVGVAMWLTAAVTAFVP